MNSRHAHNKHRNQHGIFQVSFEHPGFRREENELLTKRTRVKIAEKVKVLEHRALRRLENSNRKDVLNVEANVVRAQTHLRTDLARLDFSKIARDVAAELKLESVALKAESASADYDITSRFKLLVKYAQKDTHLINESDSNENSDSDTSTSSSSEGDGSSSEGDVPKITDYMAVVRQAKKAAKESEEKNRRRLKRMNTHKRRQSGDCRKHRGVKGGPKGHRTTTRRVQALKKKLDAKDVEFAEARRRTARRKANANQKAKVFATELMLAREKTKGGRPIPSRRMAGVLSGGQGILAQAAEGAKFPPLQQSAAEIRKVKEVGSKKLAETQPAIPAIFPPVALNEKSPNRPFARKWRHIVGRGDWRALVVNTKNEDNRSDPRNLIWGGKCRRQDSKNDHISGGAHWAHMSGVSSLSEASKMSSMRRLSQAIQIRQKWRVAEISHCRLGGRKSSF